MTLAPSIYDLSIDELHGYDFSRPLFVQASPPAHCFEVIDVIQRRLGLTEEHLTLLAGPTCPRKPSWCGAQIVNPEARLSSVTRAAVQAHDSLPFTVMVVTTSARFTDVYGALRDHGNVACFCHAMEPVPSLVVNTVGQFAPARVFFQIEDRPVGPGTVVGNILVAPEESQALFEAAMHRPAGHVVEIGRFNGGTAMVLAAAGRYSGRPGVTSIDVTRFPAADYFRRVNGFDTDIEFVEGDSLRVAEQWRTWHPDGGIALLFIDADHSQDGVFRDLAAWTPHVIPGGVVVLHDVSTPDTGVARAVYYHLMTRPEFGNMRHVRSMLLAERVSRFATGARHDMNVVERAS